MQAQSYLQQNNMGHPQRRRLYNLNDRHNLKSNVQFMWLDSLQNNELKKSKVLDVKKSIGVDKAIQIYNSYVDKELGNLFKGDKFATILPNDPINNKKSRQRSNSSQYDMSNSRVYQNNQPNNQYPNNSNVGKKAGKILDKSLNQQIQHFNQRNDLRRNSTISHEYAPSNSNMNANRASIGQQYQKRNSEQKSRYKQQLYQLSPKFLKQMLLRSALDKPDVYNRYQADKNTIRNFKPDDLENYLRVNQKKSYSYR